MKQTSLEIKSNKHKDHTQSRYEADIEKRLRQGSCTSVELRHELDCLRVAPTIFDLRHQKGLNIQTTWTYAENPGGTRHRVGLYTLLPGKWEGGKDEGK